MSGYFTYYTDPAVFSSPTGGNGVVTVYTGHCKLIGFSALNTSGSTVYAQVFDAAGTPTTGTPPKALLEVPSTAGSNQQAFDVGSAHWLPVSTGLTIAASSSSTSYTAAAGTPLWLTVFYSV